MDQMDHSPEKTKMLNEKNRKKIKISLIIILTSILFFFLLYKFSEVGSTISAVTNTITPVLYGVAIAYLLNPLVERIRKPLTSCLAKQMKNQERAAKIAKAFAITVSVICALVIVSVLLWLIIPQLIESISKLVDAMPGYIKSVMDWYDNALESGSDWANVVKEYLDKGLKALNTWLSTDLMDTINTAVTRLTSSVIDFLSFIVNMLIGIVVAIYALIEKDKFVGQAKKLTYTLFKPERANSIIDTARHGDKIFGGFLSGKILDSLIVGVIAFICLSIFKMPYTLLISVIIGVTNIIPFFGPFIGAIPCAFFILLINPMQCLWFVIFIVILQQIDGNIIGPKILGTTTGISEFWVTFSLLLFGGLFGFIGMIIGVPLFAVIYYVIKNLINRKIQERGLPAETALYRNAGSVDPETLEFTELPQEETSKKKKESKPPKKQK